MKRITIFPLLLLASMAQAQMRITEWMYSGNDGEFVEFTNVGDSPIDMTFWSFDDNSEIPFSTDLSEFGVVNPGESVIMCENPAATFIAAWGLSGVKVIGDNINNLGRADEINLYDGDGNLVDRLTYDDQTGNGPRANNLSANIPASALGLNNASSAVLSTSGDSYGSWAGSGGSIGNPGKYTSAPVEVVPTSYSIFRGTLISGTIDDLAASDDSKVVVRNGFTSGLTEYPIQIIVEGTASTTSASSFRFTLESSCSLSDRTQTIQLWDFANNQYVTVDSRVGTLTDSVVEVNVTTNASNFIAEDGTVRAKISLGPWRNILLGPWVLRLDLIHWTISN